MTPPLISLEEHYFSRVVLDSFENSMKEGLNRWPGAYDRLLDVGKLRLDSMDQGKISLQVVSHCASERPPPDICSAGNDDLAAKIKESKADKRFAGFAILPMGYPEAAAAELERTVKKLGFVGALVDNKYGDQFYDGDEYDVLWKKAEELDVPIYLHPSWPTEELFRRSYAGNYPTDIGLMMGGAIWGWHTETGLHVLRLFAAGVFDRFPKLKLILGHFGEMLPYMLERVKEFEEVRFPCKRRFVEVWDENIWITTSGCWSINPMHCILANTKVEHILYSVDYPFTTNDQGLKWITDLEKSGIVTNEQLEMIAYKNAEQLLKIKHSE